jgi:voltage-gated sodium channel
MFLVVFETDAGVDDGESPIWIKVLTNCLLGIYTSELLVKIYVYRVRFVFDFWNILDSLIVGVDLIFVLISLVVDALPSIAILRVFRLVRLARAFKAAKAFHELNSLLRACACAIKAIFWGMVMMGLTLTVWGILSVQLIHPINTRIAKSRPWLYEGCDRCPRAFSTVFDSVLTIWKQLVAGDSWGKLCEPIVEEEHWTFFFFVLVLVTVTLTMLNCILAVVVEAGAAAAAADEHDKAIQEEKAVVQAEGKLIGLCENLDKDASGSLNIEEFLEGFHHNMAFKECLEVMHVTESDMFMIFNICDEDDSGDVDYREFVDQLRRIKHSGEQMLLHYVTDIRHLVNKIRPECLKAPSKKDANGCEMGCPKDIPKDNHAIVLVDQKSGEQEKQDESVRATSNNQAESKDAGVMGGMCPALAEILGVNDVLKDGQKVDASRIDMNGLENVKLEEKLERIFRMSEELVTVMRSVAQQSTVQIGLLNSLLGGAPDVSLIPPVSVPIGSTNALSRAGPPQSLLPEFGVARPISPLPMSPTRDRTLGVKAVAAPPQPVCCVTPFT